MTDRLINEVRAGIGENIAHLAQMGVTATPGDVVDVETSRLNGRPGELVVHHATFSTPVDVRFEMWVLNARQGEEEVAIELTDRGRHQLARWAAGGDLVDQHDRLARDVAETAHAPTPTAAAEALIERGWRYLGG